jgi:hypothetical protein
MIVQVGRNLGRDHLRAINLQACAPDDDDIAPRKTLEELQRGVETGRVTLATHDKNKGVFLHIHLCKQEQQIGRASQALKAIVNNFAAPERKRSGCRLAAIATTLYLRAFDVRGISFLIGMRHLFCGHIRIRIRFGMGAALSTLIQDEIKIGSRLVKRVVFEIF